MSVDDSERIFSAVFVPADPNQPVQEIEVRQKQGDAFGCMTSHCKKHFSQQMLKGNQVGTFAKQVKEHVKGQEVTDEMMKMMSGITTCSLILLHPNVKQTDFMAVNMYVDDQGVAKELPVNPRGTMIAQSCGMAVQVIGDSFIARQFDDDEGFKRFDFKMTDLNTDLPWFKVAREFNLRKAHEDGKPEKFLESEESKRQAAIVKHSADFKAEGNQLFGKGEYELAIECYGKAVKALELQLPSADKTAAVEYLAAGQAHLILSNRSACFYKLNKYDEALADAEAAIASKPQWAKSFGRKADALAGLERHQEAVEAMEKAISLSPTSPGFVNRLERMKSKLAGGGEKASVEQEKDIATSVPTPPEENK